MIRTLKHLAYVLKVDLSEINSIIANIDKFYYEKRKVKTKDDGTPKTKNGVIQIRVLNPSLKRLKTIQERIQENIFQQMILPNYAYGGVKGKDNISNAKKHQGNKFIFTTDLANFFPSIRNKNVFDMFRLNGFSPTVSSCLTKLTTYKGRIPQGAPTSTMLANLVFVKTGKNLLALSKSHQLVFTSFVDDLTFSCKTDFKDISNLILEAIKADGYRISHNKTNYKTKKPIVTGVVVKNNGLDVTDEFKKKLSNTDGYSEEKKIGLKRYYERVKNSKK